MSYDRFCMVSLEGPDISGAAVTCSYNWDTSHVVCFLKDMA